MSRYDRSAHTGSDRANLYDEITGKIIAELEAGRIPWVQPWGTSAAKAPLGLPQNASTGRNYSGINVLILWGAVIEHGFPGQGWLTFRQALSLGGNVRKGERGTTVVYTVSIGVQKGPPIGVQKGPRLSSGVTGMAGVPFALVAA